METPNATEIVLFISCCGAASAEAAIARRPILAISRLKNGCMSNFLRCKDSEAGGIGLSRFERRQKCATTISELTGSPAGFAAPKLSPPDEVSRSIEWIWVAFNGLLAEVVTFNEIFSNRCWPIDFLTTWRQAMNLNPKICICLIALTGVAGLPSPLHAQTAGACLYESKSYSEGASICLRPSLMLSCRLEGARLVWNIVTDQDTIRLCSPPPVSASYGKPARTRVKAAAPLPRPAAVAAKCFQFNGRTYCE